MNEDKPGRSAHAEAGHDDGFEVVIDSMSLAKVAGATIDYADGLQRQGFTIANPNAAGSCACGDSFH